MNGRDFLRLITEAFVPFLTDLGFSMGAPQISGRYYLIDFTGSAHAVSISYEPGDDALFVMVFGRENGRLSDVDDRIKTPRLADLNRRYMHTVRKEEHAANDSAFSSVVVRDSAERLLLKAAKDLRLVLPKYLSS